MVVALQRFIDILSDSTDISDNRMNRFLMKSPLELITIIFLYLAAIYKIGPHVMKNRNPFSLKRVIIVYNLIQIGANGAIFHMAFSFSKHLNVWCTPPDSSSSETNLLELRIHYFYLLLKYFDLIETIFYVLRKKRSQMSFLHVYHHIGILLAAWISGKYFPGGQAIYVALYNSLIHCIMYCYYLYTSWNPSENRATWWKKYVTLLQIIQHCAIFCCVTPAVINSNCSYPKGWMAAFSLNVSLIIYLFVQFYKNTYLKNDKIR